MLTLLVATVVLVSPSIQEMDSVVFQLIIVLHLTQHLDPVLVTLLVSPNTLASNVPVWSGTADNQIKIVYLVLILTNVPWVLQLAVLIKLVKTPLDLILVLVSPITKELVALVN